LHLHQPGFGPLPVLAFGFGGQEPPVKCQRLVAVALQPMRLGQVVQQSRRRLDQVRRLEQRDRLVVLADVEPAQALEEQAPGLGVHLGGGGARRLTIARVTRRLRPRHRGQQDHDCGQHDCRCRTRPISGW
jgi:hypothetical protein